ncbi:fucolectin-7-like [Littorina saxatilis]|uniref:fucolectin-7-like n=1 Tax=Littorina saxatilis TaxID=31220 RepID=UPI0038B51F8D
MAMSVKMERFNLCLFCLHVLLSSTDTTNELSNVALHKPTHQHPGTRHVGPPPGNVAGLSVDGIRLTSLDYCSHTVCPPTVVCSQEPKWWVVDLQGFYVIHAVVITNRGERHGYRLSNFDLETYSDNPVAFPSAKRNLCFHQQSPVGDGATVTFDCKEPTRGRYFKVDKMSQEALQLCEVEVLADLQGAQAAGQLFLKATDEKAAGNVIWETTVGSAAQCGIKCAKEPGCTAFDLGPEIPGGVKARPCRLLIFGGLLQNTSFTITTSGWSFWDLQ